MRNIRVFYEKRDRMRFVSHLDMNRFMSRMIHKSKIPVWYTEGFNKHPYITFALPLSLGFESSYEVMDFRIIDDDFKDEQIKTALNAVMPPYIKIVDVAEPQMKAGSIAFAEFDICFNGADQILREKIELFLQKNEIFVQKVSKKGAVSLLNLAEKIKKYEVLSGENLTLNIVLPAGSKDNVNPSVLLDAMNSELKMPDYVICRTALFDENMQLFK